MEQFLRCQLLRFLSAHLSNFGAQAGDVVQLRVALGNDSLPELVLDCRKRFAGGPLEQGRKRLHSEVHLEVDWRLLV